MIYLKDYPPFMYKNVSSLASLSELQLICYRKNKLDTTGKLFRHFAKKQMSTSKRQRDMSGVKLLMNDHQNISNEVKGQLRELTDKRMIHGDARVAETCLIMKDPYLKSEAFGHSIDDENLMNESKAQTT